ncbi:MAG: HAD family hydrolase [Oligoflexia bacterium]|nr:HAD family hydrolase [Oligoflexia bacterium]
MDHIDINKEMEKQKKTYKNYIFDCDGVILRSNHIKTDAMRTLVAPYGNDLCEDFVSYHKSNAGAPRISKFIHLFENILKIKSPALYQQRLKQMLDDFEQLTLQKLVASDEINGISKYLKHLETISNIKKFVISGSPQSDLRYILKEKKLDIFFDEIYGSPQTKIENLNKLKNNYDLSDSIYFGDSLIDYQMAQMFDMDFVFVYGASEFENWRDFFMGHNEKERVELIKDFSSYI